MEGLENRIGYSNLYSLFFNTSKLFSQVLLNAVKHKNSFSISILDDFLIDLFSTVSDFIEVNKFYIILEYMYEWVNLFYQHWYILSLCVCLYEQIVFKKIMHSMLLDDDVEISCVFQHLLDWMLVKKLSMSALALPWHFPYIWQLFHWLRL